MWWYTLCCKIHHLKWSTSPLATLVWFWAISRSSSLKVLYGKHSTTSPILCVDCARPGSQWLTCDPEKNFRKQVTLLYPFHRWRNLDSWLHWDHSSSGLETRNLGPETELGWHQLQPKWNPDSFIWQNIYCMPTKFNALGVEWWTETLPLGSLEPNVKVITHTHTRPTNGECMQKGMG